MGSGCRSARVPNPLDGGGIDSDRHAGPLLLQQHGGTGIPVVPAAIARLRHFLQHHVRQPHRHAEFTAKLGGERDILVGEAQREGRRIELSRQEMIAQPVKTYELLNVKSLKRNA